MLEETLEPDATPQVDLATGASVLDLAGNESTDAPTGRHRSERRHLADLHDLALWRFRTQTKTSTEKVSSELTNGVR